MRSWGQDAWVSIPPLLSDVLCRLVFYLFFFFFKLRSELGQGNKIRTFRRGCSQAWEQSWELLPATGLARSPMASF